MAEQERTKVHFRIKTPPLSDGSTWTLAATVHLPPEDRRRQISPVLVCLPGGGYNRHYFDLDAPGYSEAEHHTSRGVIVIAIDHLRVGDSDIPELEIATLERTAEANHALLQILLERLRNGELMKDVAPLSLGPVIGEGQSMGGHIALLMQARHHTFAAVAILGSSVVCTRLPARERTGEVCLLGKSNPAEELARLRDLDWRYAFHWDDVPEQFAGADMAARHGQDTPAYWLSATTPNASEGLLPGFLARHVAGITVPVLIAMGERDVCQDPLREMAAFMSVRDLALFVAPKMGHMHNFAGTRAMLWNRLSAFIDQVRMVYRAADHDMPNNEPRYE
ncbi:alpha/beta hydrolase [Novosphingobium sp. BL-8A]|uniref:alpha/beta hydrolase n=1 Tax=Novosphingobium sp. BL-8A TaxID=3127639 RepID=UPI00375719FC